MFLYYCSECFVFTFYNTTFLLSKEEATIESSVFGADLLDMKTVVEVLRGLYYNFCMMGGCFGWNAKDPAADLAMKNES